MTAEVNIDRCKIIVGDKIERITPEIVAELFAHLSSDEQAKFFNHVADVASTWSGGGLAMQMQFITDEHGLSVSGRRVMQMIGEYSHWGFVPRASYSF